jgi:hypothetical protein
MPQVRARAYRSRQVQVGRSSWRPRHSCYSLAAFGRDRHRSSRKSRRVGGTSGLQSKRAGRPAGSFCGRRAKKAASPLSDESALWTSLTAHLTVQIFGSSDIPPQTPRRTGSGSFVERSGIIVSSNSPHSQRNRQYSRPSKSGCTEARSRCIGLWHRRQNRAFTHS